MDGQKKWLCVFPISRAEAKENSEMTVSCLTQELTQMLGGPCPPFKIISQSIWSIGSHIAQTFAVGRIFLAGGSMHEFSPTGGLGMNTGIEDADNLAWKIAYVVQKRAHASILDSYEQERLPIVLENMAWSMQNLKCIVAMQMAANKPSLSPEQVASILQSQKQHLNKSHLELGVQYQSDWLPCSRKKKSSKSPYQSTVAPGARWPHFWLTKEKKFFSSIDFVGVSFSLFYETDAVDFLCDLDFKTLAVLHVVLGQKGGLIEKEPGIFQKLHGLQTTAVVWVRPDGYVAWRGDISCAEKRNEWQALIEKITLGKEN